MPDVLAAKGRAAGVSTLVARYLPSKKNGVVADRYDKLGSLRIVTHSDGSVGYGLDIANYQPLTSHIRLKEKSS